MKKHFFQRLTKMLLFSSLAALFVMGGISAFSSNNDIKEAKAGSDYSGIPKNWNRGNGQLFDIYEAENHYYGKHDGEHTGDQWSGNVAISINQDTNYLYNSVSRSCAGIYYFVLGLNHGDRRTAVVKTTANANTSDENFYTLNFTTGGWDDGPKTDHGFIYLKKGVNDIKITFTGSNGYVHFDYFAISQLPTQFEAEWAYVEGHGTLYTRQTTPHTSKYTSYGKAVRTTKNQYIQSQVYAPQEISGEDYALSVAYYSNTINPLVSLYIDDVLVKSDINLRYINGLSTFIIGSNDNSATRLALAHRITNISIQPGMHFFKLVNSGSASGGDATIDFDYFELVKSSLDESPALPNELALIHDMNGKTSLSIESEYAAAYPGYDDFANPSTDPYFRIKKDDRSSNGFMTDFSHATNSFPGFEVLNATEGWYTLSFDGVPWFSNAQDTVTFRFSSHQDSKQISETYAQFVMEGKTEDVHYTNMTTRSVCNIYLKSGDNVIMYNYAGGSAYFDLDRFTLKPYTMTSDGHFLIELSNSWTTANAKTAIHYTRVENGDTIAHHYTKLLNDDNLLKGSLYLAPIPDGIWTNAELLRINPACPYDSESSESTNPYADYTWNYSWDITFGSNFNRVNLGNESHGKWAYSTDINNCVVGGESVYLDLSALPGWEGGGAVLGVWLQGGLGSTGDTAHVVTRVEGFDIGGSGENHLYEYKIPVKQAFTVARFYRDNPEGGNWNITDDLDIVGFKNTCKVTAWDSGDKICPSSFDWNMDDNRRADCFGTYFLNQTGEQCESYNTNTAESFSTIWTNVNTQYDNMSKGAEDLFTECNTLNPHLDTTYKDAAQRYDYILSKYGTSVLDDFAKRNRINVPYPSSKVSFNYLTINGDMGTTVIIIISSSIALLSITVLSITMVKKRKNRVTNH